MPIPHTNINANGAHAMLPMKERLEQLFERWRLPIAQRRDVMFSDDAAV